MRVRRSFVTSRRRCRRRSSRGRSESESSSGSGLAREQWESGRNPVVGGRSHRQSDFRYAGKDPCNAAYARAASSRLRVMRQPMEYGIINVPFIS